MGGTTTQRGPTVRVRHGPVQELADACMMMSLSGMIKEDHVQELIDRIKSAHMDEFLEVEMGCAILSMTRVRRIAVTLCKRPQRSVQYEFSTLRYLS